MAFRAGCWWEKRRCRRRSIRYGAAIRDEGVGPEGPPTKANPQRQTCRAKARLWWEGLQPRRCSIWCDAAARRTHRA
ncbi:DUF6053 domain-containing protein [Lysobacter enzymogenes]|uniref:DUF6053 domain-containing protein n=1 Tax=Lysobacter enzymogenes TaxID=69 RepID=UPI0037498EEF